jgi:hypothetical protein
MISFELISSLLDLFKIDVVQKLKKDQFIYVLLKLKMLPENDDKVIFRSITKAQRVNEDAIDILKEVFFET